MPLKSRASTKQLGQESGRESSVFDALGLCPGSSHPMISLIVIMVLIGRTFFLSEAV